MRGKTRKYLSGYLKIHLSGGSSERFMNLCTHQKIHLWDIKVEDQIYEMKISTGDFMKLKPIIRKTRTKVKVLERSGFPFFIQKYKARYFLFSGFFLCVLFLLFMSTFVWEIKVNGNVRCSDEEIKSFLSDIGVYAGRQKKEISCARIGEKMREHFEEIIWVSASMDGVELKIDVKENMDRFEVEDMTEELPIDIVAEKDGMITSIITSKGHPVVKAGDMVKKGDILVSGTVEIYNDAMEVIGYHYYPAEAEIYAQTELTYENVMEHNYDKLEETGKKRYQFWIENKDYVRFIGIPVSGYKYYQITTKQKEIILGGIVPLPLEIGIREITECKKKTKTYTDEEIQFKLSEKNQRFCQDLEKKGVQILKNDVKIYNGIERTSARGVLILEERIGESLPGKKININEEQEGNVLNGDS